MDTKNFPKYVNDYPIGEDLFEGKSQEKVADNIISYLRENTLSKKRVIGIDGEWGAGKSNVIEIIRKKTKSEFHIFTFDAWGHQEDLTRRTFLEELTDDLILTKIISNDWSDKLKSKLATNKETITQNTPEFNPILVIFILLVLLSPIVKQVFEYVLLKNNSSFPGLFSILLTLGYVVIGFLITWGLSKNDDKPTLGKLFFLYKGQQIKTSKHETITSLEPSVREFRNLLQEIVSSINKTKKLIYVFDNMDRLPVKNVKEIWSSIHTFFADVQPNNNDSWVLIPYDEKHICKVFSDEQGSNHDFTVSYIQKTFSIVFRIAPPILSDWKKYFENKFTEAFNFAPPPQEQLANLFDYLHNDYTIKPRQILDYINNLVVLNKQWNSEIPLRYCGLFILTKNQILENPIKVIIEKTFIKNVESIFAGDENLEKYISALVFIVEINKADEVLIRRSIEKTLRGESSLKLLSNHPAFISVLDSCFYSSKVDVEYTINEFDNLPTDIKIGNGFDKYWKQLTLLFMQQELLFPNCELYYKKLFINLSNNELRIDLLKYVLNKIALFKKDDKFIYRGGNYAEIIDDVVEYFKSIDIKINVLEYCNKLSFGADDFIDFVDNCKLDYKSYNIKCAENDLNELLIQKLPIEISEYFDFLNKTRKDFEFKSLIVQIESQIKTLTTSVASFQTAVDNLFSVYKIISKDKPHAAKIPSNQALAILNTDLNQAKAIDLVLSMLSDIPNRPTYIINPNVLLVLNKVDNLEYAASIAEYYMNYESFIDITLSHPLPLLEGIVKAITYKNYGISRLSIRNALGKYDQIRTNIIKKDEEYAKAFIKRFNQWFEHYKKVLEETEFTELASISLIKDCALDNNNFTRLTLEKTNKYILEREINEWQDAFMDSENSYLFSLTTTLIECKTNSFTKLSDNAINAYKDVIVKFAKSNSIPKNIDDWDLLFDFFDGRKLKIPYKEIRDNYIYSSEQATSDALIFFEKGLFAHGGLDEKDKVDDVIRKIILPSIKDKSTLKHVILDNKEQVLKLINLSQEHKEDIIDSFKSVVNEDNTKDLQFFSDGLDFVIETENVEENK